MMGLHWKHANASAGFEHYLGDGGIFSLGFQATQTAGQHRLDFGEVFDFGTSAKDRCIEKLSQNIPKLLCDNHIDLPFSQLTDKIGSLTPASGIEIRAALQSSNNNKEIIVLSQKGGVRRSANQIHDTDVLHYNQQQLLI